MRLENLIKIDEYYDHKYVSFVGISTQLYAQLKEKYKDI